MDRKRFRDTFLIGFSAQADLYIENLSRSAPLLYCLKEAGKSEFGVWTLLAPEDCLIRQVPKRKNHQSGFRLRPSGYAGQDAAVIASQAEKPAKQSHRRARYTDTVTHYP